MRKLQNIKKAVGLAWDIINVHPRTELIVIQNGQGYIEDVLLGAVDQFVQICADIR